jgi:hypothetical protein
MRICDIDFSGPPTDDGPIAILPDEPVAVFECFAPVFTRLTF